MEFQLTIRLGNDAMQYAADVAEALRKVADKLDESGDAYPERTHTQSVFDLNGNRVGGWKITEEDS